MDAVAPRTLCRLDEIPDGGARGLTLDGPGAIRDVFAVREGDEVWVYVNVCPHAGTPLDWKPNTFLDPSGTYIMCATHGALFQIEDGLCVGGPCKGDRLHRIPVTVRDGQVIVG